MSWSPCYLYSKTSKSSGKPGPVQAEEQLVCSGRTLNDGYYYKVRTENSFQNSQTFHKHLQYGAEKQHEGTQLFGTSSEGAQPLL